MNTALDPFPYVASDHTRQPQCRVSSPNHLDGWRFRFQPREPFSQDPHEYANRSY